MEMQELKTFGFGFAIEELQDGTPHCIKVVDRWLNPPRSGKPVRALTIELQPYASYTEAMEIANYINTKLMSPYSSVIDVKGSL